MTTPATNADQTFTVKAYEGDAKILLAFDLKKNLTRNLAGFTIACKPGNLPPYYLYNKLQFKNPDDHAQNKNEPAYSSINAPFQKFRWLHVPGAFHQDQKVFLGKYLYSITPRYFDESKHLLPLDAALTVSVAATVSTFSKQGIELGFTRGFVQSQAFEHHFGKVLVLKPANAPLQFDTKQVAGKNADGVAYTYVQEYAWSGFTAREKVMNLLTEVQQDPTLSIDVFAYDLNEPDIITIFLALAKRGSIRMIMDNATLHVTDKKTSKPSAEDEFEKAFNQVAKGNAKLIRGNFSRFSHDKEIIVRKGNRALKVLTGSTNFSVTGLYVNSNHVLIFNTAAIAKQYGDVFSQVWKDATNREKKDPGKKIVVTSDFLKSTFSQQVFSFPATGVPKVEFTYSPHSEEFATTILDKLASRIQAEKKSVLFAVMGLDKKSTGPVFPALRDIHKNGQLFSYGIADTPDGIFLYKPSSKNGVLVTGKPSKVQLPPPFNQEPSIGLGHQIHHKFVVCGFNSARPTVYCGSSNLALLGEQQNGDNLITIHDADIAVVFALEALALVDHFHFRNASQGTTPSATAQKPLLLKTDNSWSAPYYDTSDLHYTDRMLFR